VSFFLGFVGVIFVLAVVLPGILYIYIGLKTRRKDEVAMESLYLAIPYYLFLLLIILGSSLVGTDVLPPDTRGLDFMQDRLLPPGPARIAAHSLFLPLFFIPWLFAGLLSVGQILVIRGNRRNVAVAIQRILEHRNLRFRITDDAFDIPSVKLKIHVNETEDLRWVHVRTKTKDKLMAESIQEDLLNMFEGTARARAKPHMVIMGGVITSIGVGLGVVFTFL
jgi:hypothetical protein